MRSTSTFYLNSRPCSIEDAANHVLKNARNRVIEIQKNVEQVRSAYENMVKDLADAESDLAVVSEEYAELFGENEAEQA